MSEAGPEEQEAAPRVLVVTSVGAPEMAVVPVLAELEALQLAVRAIDVGRVGSRSSGAVDKVLRAVMGELAERRLLRELGSNPPDVTLAFDPGSATVLGLARDEAPIPAPVVAVVADLVPDPAWADADADRYLVLDDEAAAVLEEHGVPGERILPIGPLCSHVFVAAAAHQRTALRERFQLGSGPVVLVEVAGLGGATSSQLALQLSLGSARPVVLFDAGADREAAGALRETVPGLDLRAKLFGRTADAALLWRCADVVVARPRPRALAQAMCVGASFLSLMPEGEAERALAAALEQRGFGLAATTPLLLQGTLETLLQRGSAAGPGALAGTDGAANLADILWVVARDRRGIIAEIRDARRAVTRERAAAAGRAAEASRRAGAEAGELEDLGATPGAGAGPSAGELDELRRELSVRLAELGRELDEVRREAEAWQARADQRAAAGDAGGQREAGARADAARGRMHEVLGEMAELEAQRKRLEQARPAARPRPATPRAGAPSPGPRAEAGAPRPGSAGARPVSRPAGKDVDELLAELKRGRASASAQTIEDELAALKKKMTGDKGGAGRR